MIVKSPVKRKYQPIREIKLKIGSKTLIPKYALTDKQLELFSIIYKYNSQHKEPPTLRYCWFILWIKHVPVYDRMRWLVKKWYIYRPLWERGYKPSAWAIFLVKKWILKLKDYDI